MEAMTLQQSKDKVAKKYLYSSFQELMDDHKYSIALAISDEAFILYCQSQKANVWKEGFHAGIEGHTFNDNPYKS